MNYLLKGNYSTRFCGETDITLDYGSRIQGSNPCRTAILKF